eukprot:CAMPEP_0183722758 /NCGR_PEP_ID=MMETSP0737-20130205/14630_1 /TAXON_ID=385413 /ORGANISM="Thalassiosira miniscula, Strain CCMP1093" /LENGTH=379 /DNA_ID=CAMNT_0025952993 /DNA_START=18 /DNA_END=1154 /DNA_ORIENTATION=+
MKTTKQKEGPRQLIASDISYLPDTLCNSGNWDLRPTSFQAREVWPLEVAQFNAGKGRYEVKYESGVTEDDVIVQSMIVCLLYRMEKGWGKARSFQALSIWSGKRANANDVDDDFPLDNLWEDEIQSLIREKKLGKNTLKHNDNFDNFPRLYGCSKGRRARRAGSFIGRVHIFAEQAAVQMALHLHRNVSKAYSFLSAVIVHMALQSNSEERGQLMYALADTLLHSARKESNNFPDVALRDIFPTRREQSTLLSAVSSGEAVDDDNHDIDHGDVKPVDNDNHDIDHGDVKPEAVFSISVIKTEDIDTDEEYSERSHDTDHSDVKPEAVVSISAIKTEDIDTGEEGSERSHVAVAVKTEEIDTDEERSIGGEEDENGGFEW